VLNLIKNACSWIVSQVQAGVALVWDNWPAITARSQEMARWAYEVAVSQLRKIMVAFERGMVIGIETVEKRQAMPLKQARTEAKAVVKAMTDEQVCAYAAYWFRQEPTQAVAI
jgi:hypothetical protein